MSQYKLMRGIILSALGLALSAGFFIPFQMTHAAVLYEQSKTGTAYDIFADVGMRYGFYSKLPQYSGSGVIFPGGGMAYTGTASWLRLKRLSGLSCDTWFTINIFTTDANTQIGNIARGSGVTNGDYCDFPITGNNRTDMTVGMISICINGSCNGITDSFVLDGSPENEGYVVDGTQVIFQPGGWAFQICDDGGCEGGFEEVVATTTATSTATSTDTGTGTTTATSTATSTPPTATSTGASSVLFLPGIQASRLYTDGLLGTEDEVWTPNNNQDVRQLTMDVSGESVNNIYTRDILSSIPVLGPTVYEDFTAFMDQLALSSVIKSWAPFAYDWRYGVGDIAENGTQYENEVKEVITEIERLASSSFTEKATIIGHSNGGLLAKAVMQRLESEGKANIVDRVIFLASPQLGTPKAIGTILHGFDQEKAWGWLIDDEVARDVIQNMPGAYGLITSEEYFNRTNDKVISFENSTSTAQFRGLYGDTIDSVEELGRFLTGVSDGRAQATTIDDVLNANSALVSDAFTQHKDTLDNWVAPTGVEIVEIVGTGLDTVTGFEYRNFRERFCTNLGTCEIRDIYKPVPLVSKAGDKTVVSMSAEAYVGDKKLYYIDLNAVEDSGGNTEHFNISENQSILTLLRNILTATTSEIEFITQTSSLYNDERILLGSHSPVDMEVTNETGKRVGKTIVNGVVAIEESIPGSSYFEIGSSKYIIVPKTGDYKIKVIGTGNGSLTFTQDALVGNTQIATYAIEVATISASTTIKATFTNDLSNLEIDTNSDGNIDKVLTPLGVDVTPKITYRDLRSKINSLSLSQARKLPLQILVETADQLDKKSVTNPKLTPLETLALNQLEALLITYQKKKWISQAEIDALKFIINKLK